MSQFGLQINRFSYGEMHDAYITLDQYSLDKNGKVIIGHNCVTNAEFKNLCAEINKELTGLEHLFSKEATNAHELREHRLARRKLLQEQKMEFVYGLLDILARIESENSETKLEELFNSLSSAINSLQAGRTGDGYVLLMNEDKKSIKPFHIEPASRYYASPPLNNNFKFVGCYPTQEQAISACAEFYKPGE